MKKYILHIYSHYADRNVSALPLSFRSGLKSLMCEIVAFVGKGGVGKTSVSSAYAKYCSGKGKTLIISSDFMPSLRYIFPADSGNPEVVELSEKEVAARWKQRYAGEVKSVLSEFIDVNDWMIDHVAESPGVAEEFMISNIVELADSGKYDYVVWDTAASSSTMHLLLLEREFYEHLDRDVRIFLKLKSRFKVSKTLEILESWKKLANTVWNRLVTSRFYMVTTQDSLSLIQAREIMHDMEEMGLAIQGTICNRCKKERPGLEGGMFLIPELEGTPAEIVEQIKGRLDRLLESRGLKSHG